MNFSNPHRVLLFFEAGPCWQQQHPSACLQEQWTYYEGLQQQGKVGELGTPAHGPGIFVTLSVSSDAELELILQQDPALQQQVLQVQLAYPYQAVG